MRRFRLLTVLAGLAAVAALITSAALVRAGHRRLLTDWTRLQTGALALGARLDGAPSVATGWPLAATRRIASPALFLPGGIVVAAVRVDLRRPILAPDRLEVRSTELTLSRPPGMRVARLWGEQAASLRVDAKGWVLSARNLRLATGGGGPDDVAAAVSGRGTLRDGPAGLDVVVDLERLALPLSEVSGRASTLDHASLHARLSGPPRNPSIDVVGADVLWDRLNAHLTGHLRVDGSGMISGRLALSLGRGWRQAIGDAGAGGLVAAPVARAAIGVVALLAPDGPVRDIPVAVDAGRVTVGGMLVFRCPDLAPVRGSGMPPAWR